MVTATHAGYYIYIYIYIIIIVMFLNANIGESTQLPVMTNTECHNCLVCINIVKRLGKGPNPCKNEDGCGKQQCHHHTRCVDLEIQRQGQTGRDFGNKTSLCHIPRRHYFS